MTTHYITANQGSLSTDNGDTVYLAEGVTISGGIDMRGTGGGDQSLILYGTVFGSLDDYWDVSSGNDQIFIGSTGKISTSGVGAFRAGGGAHAIVNEGTLSAHDGGAIYIAGAAGAHQTERTSITNLGTMSSVSATPSTATIAVFDGAGTTIDNSGDIVSLSGIAISLTSGDNVITNTGRIQGNVGLGSGNDLFDSRGGQLFGQVQGGSGNDTIWGSTEDNTLIGALGDDKLDGSLGADTMIGGDGNDSYWVDSSDDVVDENNATWGGGGTDTIKSSISFDLSDTTHVIGTVERLALLGAANINGTGSSRSETILGNAGDNVIRGEAGNDKLNGYAGDDRLGGAAGTDELYGRSGEDLLVGGADNDLLDGGSGADTMLGGAGNDTYVVDDIDDVVDETANGSSGSDLVKSTITFRLSDTAHVKGPVEKLTLLGSDAIAGVGNALANTITGNSAANTIDGGTGNDTLAGGGGADKFRFSTALVANFDTINGFVHNTDKILLDSTIFTKLSDGALAAANFAINAAGDANDFIIYNTTTGVITYDTNGNGAGGAVNFAKLTAVPGITQADFQIV